MQSHPDDQASPRPKKWWLAILAAVVVIVAIVSGIASLVSGGDDEKPTAASSPQRTVTQTTSPSAASSESTGPSASTKPKQSPAVPKGTKTLKLAPQEGRCMVPTPTLLANAKVAFGGTVTDVDAKEGLALFSVKRWFKAEGFGGTDTIMVKWPARTKESSLSLEKGKRYLISAGDDATVSLCGFSDQWSPALAKKYRTAFKK